MNRFIKASDNFFNKKITKYQIPMPMVFVWILFTLEVITRFLELEANPWILLYLYICAIYEYLHEKRQNKLGL